MTDDPGKTDRELEGRYTHYMEDDELVVVDNFTGDIVKRAPRIEDQFVPGKQLSPKFMTGTGKYWTYTEMYRDLIRGLIAKGKTITEISKTPGFPPINVISRWRAENEDFDNAIREARKMRAELYADKIAESVDETRTLAKEQIPAEKLYMDKLKWLAEKNDPDTYGTKFKGDNSNEGTVIIRVDTGISRHRESDIEVDKTQDEIEDVPFEEK